MPETAICLIGQISHRTLNYFTRASLSPGGLVLKKALQKQAHHQSLKYQRNSQCIPVPRRIQISANQLSDLRQIPRKISWLFIGVAKGATRLCKQLSKTESLAATALWLKLANGPDTGELMALRTSVCSLRRSCQSMESTDTFTVKYRSASRTLTKEQLQRAPNSLLSTILLAEECTKCPALEVPSDTSAPGLACWRNGSEELFEVRLCLSLNESYLVLIKPFQGSMLAAPSSLRAQNPREKYSAGVLGQLSAREG